MSYQIFANLNYSCYPGFSDENVTWSESPFLVTQSEKDLPSLILLKLFEKSRRREGYKALFMRSLSP